jgi:hypothetical protein
MKKIRSLEFAKKILSNYLDSFRKLWNYKSKLLYMVLIDFFYIIIIYLILFSSYLVFASEYLNQITPIAEKVGNINKAENMDEALNITMQLNEQLLGEFDPEKPFSKTYSIITFFISKLIGVLLLLLIFASIIKAVIWSFIKKSFKQFKKVIFMNLIWYTFCFVFILALWLLFKNKFFLNVGLFLILILVYFTIIQRTRFDNEKPIIKQMLKNISIGIKGFIHLFIPLILILLTLIIIINIFALIAIFINPILISIIMFIILLVFTSWSRVYLYNVIKLNQ